MLTIKRLPFLDGLRGVTIIGMMIMHSMEFATFDPSQGGMIYLGPNSPMTRAPLEPLASMTTMFFCIMGMSLPVSLSLRKQKGQSFLTILRHIATRSALLILVGLVLASASDFVLGTGTGLSFVFNGKEPISMLGFADLLAFAVIFFFPAWQRLLLLSGISFLAITALLMLPVAPLLGIAGPLLLSGPWSMLKCLPVILFGAGVTAAVVQNRPVNKKILISFAATLFILLEFIIPSVYTGPSSMYYFMVPTVMYQMSLGYLVFKILEERGHKMIPFIVAGRTGLYLYGIHLSILVAFLLFIPHTPGLLTVALVSSASLATLWPAAYLYLKWKVGDIGAQYVSFKKQSMDGIKTVGSDGKNINGIVVAASNSLNDETKNKIS